MNPEQVARTEALSRLAIATQARIDRQVLDVYLEDLKDYPTPVLVEACKRLHRADFFPKVGELRVQCGEVRTEFHSRQLAEEHARYLKLHPPPEYDAEQEQRRKDRLAKFLQDVKAVCERKAMK
jgi:hypothetical protein